MHLLNFLARLLLAAAMLLPLARAAQWLGFAPLPPLLFGLLPGMMLAFPGMVEDGKQWFN